MDNLIPCFVFIALAVLLLPFALVIAHARKIKNLEATLRKLSARIDALDAAPRAAQSCSGCRDCACARAGGADRGTSQAGAPGADRGAFRANTTATSDNRSAVGSGFTSAGNRSDSERARSSST